MMGWEDIVQGQQQEQFRPADRTVCAKMMVRQASIMAIAATIPPTISSKSMLRPFTCACKSPRSDLVPASTSHIPTQLHPPDSACALHVHGLVGATYLQGQGDGRSDHVLHQLDPVIVRLVIRLVLILQHALMIAPPQALILRRTEGWHV